VSVCLFKGPKKRNLAKGPIHARPSSGARESPLLPLGGLGWVGSLESKNDSKAATRKRSKKLKKELVAPPVRTPIIVNKSSRGRFQEGVVVMPGGVLEGCVVDDDDPRDIRLEAGVSRSSSCSNDFASSSGIDTFCPRLFFCSEVCRDAWNALALVFRSNHCEKTG
jgi:hypothetical protein